MPSVMLRALVLLLAIGPSVALGAAAPLSSSEWLLEQVKMLSAPENEGRASGTRGADRAAAQIAALFKQAAWDPAGTRAGTCSPSR